jgi:hypothetical protein
VPACGHHIYHAPRTIFHKSSTKLTNWFFAMHLMTSTRHGVAAKELQRQIGCTYKTAWRMAHELRKHMANADQPLSGHVEVDETIVGGHRSRAITKEKGSNITVVMGIVERGGKIIAGPVPDITVYTLEPIVRVTVTLGSAISTNELRSYQDLDRAGDYVHGRVNHKDEQWIDGIHHTNTLEGHWSRFKRSISSAHVHVSGEHMWKHVSEFYIAATSASRTV